MFKFWKSFLLLFVLIFGFAGQANASTTLRPNVKILVAPNSSALRTFQMPGRGTILGVQTRESLSGAMTLEGSVNGVQMGDVLVSSEGEGFLKKVKSVRSREDGRVVVETEQATLLDLFEDADIKISRKLTAQDFGGASNTTMPDSVPALPSNRLDDNLLRYSPPGLSYPFVNTKIEGNGGSVELNGSVSVQPSIDLDLSIRYGRLTKCRFVSEVEGRINLKATATRKVQFFDKEVTYAKLPPFTFYVTVAPLITIPVKVSPTFNLKIDGALENGVTVTNSASLTVGGGFDYESGRGIRPVAIFQPSFRSSVETDTALKFSFTPVRIVMNISMYGVSGPYLFLDAPNISAEFRPQGWQLCYDIDARVIGGAGFKTKLLGADIDISAPISTPPYHIANGCFGSPTVPPPPPPSPNRPPNDNFEGRVTLYGNAGSNANYNSANATKQNGEPNHASNGGGRSLWYRWVAPANGVVVISTQGSSFDTLLGVYRGSAVNGLSKVVDNDDVRQGVTSSQVTFNVQGGVAYEIAVDGYKGASGNVRVNWAFSNSGGPTAPAPLPPAPNPQPQPQPTSPPPPTISTYVSEDWAAPSAGAPGFTRSGPSEWWHWASGYGDNNRMLWTRNANARISNAGDWRPNLPESRPYEVFVFIPRNYATTTRARYTVYHADGQTDVVRDQSGVYDAWISLGTFRFNSGTGGHLTLVDMTGETSESKMIGLDAAKWEPRAVPPPPPPPVTTEVPETSIAAREGAPGFWRHGPAQWWYEDSTVGHGGRMLWTRNAKDRISNMGDWRPNLPESRWYEIYVHIPRKHANTSKATYEIYHADGRTDVRIRQDIYFDVWVSLGSYRFNSGTSGFLRLIDMTTETSETKEIGFDTAKWEPRATPAPPPPVTTYVSESARASADGAPGFWRHGPPEWWREATGVGQEGRMTWTQSTPYTIFNMGDWRPIIPRKGKYEVYVFIPREHHTTKGARYEIYHAGGRAPINASTKRWCPMPGSAWAPTNSIREPAVSCA